MGDFSLVWKSTAAATGISLINGGGRFVATPRRTPPYLNVRFPTAATPLRTPSHLVLSGRPKAITPFPSCPKFQPSPNSINHSDGIGIWIRGIPAALGKSATALLLLMGVSAAILSGPVPAHALSQILIRKHVDQDRTRSEEKFLIEIPELDELIPMIGIGYVIGVLAGFVIINLEESSEKKKKKLGSQISVMKLQCRFSSVVSAPLIERHMRMLATVPPYDMASRIQCIYDSMNTLLPYKDHCLSTYSIGYVNNDFKALDELFAEDKTILLDGMPLVDTNVKELNNVYLVVTLYFRLADYPVLSTMNGSMSLEDALEKILSFPSDHFLEIRCTYMEAEKDNEEKSLSIVVP